MTTVELLAWLIIGGAVGVLAATFRRTEGVTWTRLLTLSMVGAVVGGLVGRTVFVPDSSTGAESPAALMIALLGSVVALLIARAQLRNRERKRFS
ncbi:MAG TPA: GlsB/YeaQ/YmgE family stress response membrane protein [Myxococcaceae bacterium]|nr:GlsB/YeaQ/YmgE family stress response membrane protein [Myxococcaceae bacterium]